MNLYYFILTYLEDCGRHSVLASPDSTNLLKHRIHSILEMHFDQMDTETEKSAECIA